VIPVEDVKSPITEAELLGEAPASDTIPSSETPTLEPEEAPVEKTPAEVPVETPAEARRRWNVANEEAQAEVQKCEMALAAAKKRVGEVARELQKLTDVKLPLHELNRLQQDITRNEMDARFRTRELVDQLSAGRRPGTPTRPPLVKTGDPEKKG